MGRWRRPSSLFYLAVAVLASAPAWIVEHPPLQDFPFHVATLRLIHDHGNPAFGFADTYRLNLFHTQYILYYLAGDLLAFVLGVKAASVAMVCICLGGVPLAMRELLAAFGKDERLCLFSIPLAYSAMFCLGLLPYVFGFPMMLLSLAAAVRHFEKPTRRSAIVLLVLTVLTFFAHVLPFALFGIGCVALFPWTRPNRWIPSAAPLAVGLVLVAWWILGSKAGGEAFHGMKSQQPFAPLDSAIAQAPQWSTNVLRDQSDEFWAVALGLVAMAALGLSAGEHDRVLPRIRGWFVLPACCVLGYLTLGAMLGDVWLFGQRFAAPGLLTSVPLLRMPKGLRGHAVAAAALFVAVGSTFNLCQHFVEFEREEVGDLDDAIASMAPRKHVAGLIFDRSSAVMGDLYAPFLHFVSYYQIEKGGLVQFAVTGSPHWPVQYEPGHFPPPGTLPRLRWEWSPEAVPITELYPFYDYVLVRGGGFRPPAGTFHMAFRGRRWTVWARD